MFMKKYIFLIFILLIGCSSSNELSVEEAVNATIEASEAKNSIELTVAAKLPTSTPLPLPTSTPLPPPTSTPLPPPTSTPTPLPVANPTPFIKSSVEILAEESNRSIVFIQTDYGLGTGFVITNDGLILTAQHVIDGANKILISPFQSSYTGTAEVIYSNFEADLAILKSDINFDDYLIIETSDDINFGHEVISIGYPSTRDLSDEIIPSVSKGIISKKFKSFDINFIEHDAQTSPGFSGGPLLSVATGNVVGVNVLVATQDIGGDNYLASSYVEINKALSQKNIIRSVDGRLVYTPSPTSTPTTSFPTNSISQYEYESLKVLIRDYLDLNSMQDVDENDDAIWLNWHSGLSYDESVSLIDENLADILNRKLEVTPTRGPSPTSTPRPWPTITPVPATPTTPPERVAKWTDLACENKNLFYPSYYLFNNKEDGGREYVHILTADELYTLETEGIKEDNKVGSFGLLHGLTNFKMSAEFILRNNNQSTYGFMFRKYTPEGLDYTYNDFILIDYDPYATYNQYKLQHHVRNNVTHADYLETGQYRAEVTILKELSLSSDKFNTGPRGWNKLELEVNNDKGKFYINDIFITDLSLDKALNDVDYYNEPVHSFYGGTGDFLIRNIDVNCLE
ncbi:MAG: hypothetical protein CL774_00090 [Chloroflexi bacterium]|nr:hypothetical protein [Chloroflexota bacterium]